MSPLGHRNFVNYFVWIPNTKIILRRKDYGCGKFLWIDTRTGEFHVLVKEMKLFEFFFKHIATRYFTAMFQPLFCLIICCTQQFHWLIILSDNLFFFGVEFSFQLQNEKKKIQYKGKRYCVFSRCACAKLKTFLSAEKFLKWTPAFNVQKEKIVNLHE